MNAVYLAIVKSIQDNSNIFSAEGLKPIAHFDKYKGQYEEPEYHQPYNMPAVFYSYKVRWDAMAHRKQVGKMTVILHIVLENLAESYAGSPDQNAALICDKYYEIIHVCVQGLGGDSFTRLKRVMSEDSETPGYVDPFKMTYECDYTDNSADVFRKYQDKELDELTLQKINPVAEPEPNKSLDFLVD